MGCDRCGVDLDSRRRRRHGCGWQAHRRLARSGSSLQELSNDSCANVSRPCRSFKSSFKSSRTVHIAMGLQWCDQRLCVELRKKYLLRGLQTCLEFGLTGTTPYPPYLVPSYLIGVHTNDHNAWYLYQELQAFGRVPMRVYVTPDQNEIGQTSIPAPKTKDGLLSCDRVKIFSDGSLGAVHSLDT